MFFDYDNCHIIPRSDDRRGISYFNNYYIDRSIELDSDFNQVQINYLEGELSSHQPIRRTSKPMREKVLRHYSRIYNVGPEIFDKKQVTQFCKKYIELENDFRSRYRDAIVKRLYWLEDSNDNLEEI